MNRIYKFYTIFLISFLFYQTSLCKLSLEGIYNNFFSKPVKQTFQKELELSKNGTLSIKNIYGNINIKTNWEKNSIMLQATKQISKKENPDDTIIKIDKQLAKNKIVIKTEYKNNKTKSPVNYELIVPNNIIANLETKNGNITIKHTEGSINAHTEKGVIKISETKGTIVANVVRGNIFIDQSDGNIEVSTKYGNIHIADATKNVSATTQSGHIKSACKHIPSVGSVELATGSGNISLALPSKTNAELKARTAKGVLLSEHFITLKPQTTTLDRYAWGRFKREVDGSLGSGESIIKLSSNSGNIKILKEATT